MGWSVVLFVLVMVLLMGWSVVLFCVANGLCW